MFLRGGSLYLIHYTSSPSHRSSYCSLPFVRKRVLIPHRTTTYLILADYRFSEGVLILYTLYLIPHGPATDLITAHYCFSEEGVLILHSPTTELTTAHYRFSEEWVPMPRSPYTVLVIAKLSSKLQPKLGAELVLFPANPAIHPPIKPCPVLADKFNSSITD